MRAPRPNFLPTREERMGDDGVVGPAAAARLLTESGRHQVCFFKIWPIERGDGGRGGSGLARRWWRGLGQGVGGSGKSTSDTSSAKTPEPVTQLRPSSFSPTPRTRGARKA